MSLSSISFLLLFFIPVYHDFHVSVMEVNHSNTTGSLEIELRIFSDDLEEALNTQYGTSLDLLNSPNQVVFDSLTCLYFIDNLEIRVNKALVKINYLGSELNDGIVYGFFESEKVVDIESIAIKNSILIDAFKNQSNLVNIYVGEKVNSLKLEGEQTRGSVNY